MDFDYANNSSLERYTDMASWMLALDLDQAYAPWLTSTGNLSANVEVYDEIDANGDIVAAEGVSNDGIELAVSD